MTLSSSVVKTETQLVTETIKLLHGNSARLTTLVTPVLTTVTELSHVTSTLDHLVTTTVISSPVTYSTSITQTETESYKVIFRARPITTTVVSTRVVPTVVTTYQTQTLTLAPTLLG